MQSNIKAGIKGTESPRSIQHEQKIKNMWHIVSLIRSKGLQEELTQEVIKTIKKYPEGSLTWAWANINSIVSKCQRKLILEGQPFTFIQEQKEEEPKKIEIENPKIEEKNIETRKPLFDPKKIPELKPKKPIELPREKLFSEMSAEERATEILKRVKNKPID